MYRTTQITVADLLPGDIVVGRFWPNGEIDSFDLVIAKPEADSIPGWVRITFEDDGYPNGVRRSVEAASRQVHVVRGHEAEQLLTEFELSLA